MDFDDRYDAELEAFRRDVRNWLDANVPQYIQKPGDGLSSSEVVEWHRYFQAQLADQGWVSPSWPLEYGGGGLTPTHDLIVQHELQAYNVPILYGSNRSVGSAILAWGAMSQK